MKKIKGVFLIIIVLLLTGCVKYDLDMELGSDKSFNLVIIDAILDDYSSMLDSSDTTTYEELGYTVSDYEDGEYVGLKLEKKYDSIDEVSSSDCGVFELTSIMETNTSDIILFKSSKSGSITSYTANFTYDLTYEESATEYSEYSEYADYSEYAEYMSFTYNFSLPSIAKNISSNADTTDEDGYSLSWNLTYGEVKNITFSFTIDENDVSGVTSSITSDDVNSDVEEEVPTEEIETIDEKETTEQTNSNNFNIFTYLGGLLFIVVIFGLIFLIRKKASSKTNNLNGSIHHIKPPSRKS